MIKTGEVKKGIEGISNNKSSYLGSLPDESFRVHDLSHPVTGKGKDVPQNDKPEEVFELKPSRVCYADRVNPVQHVYHSGDEQDMSYLMGDETFCTTMPLYSIYRDCTAYQGECQYKTKAFKF